MGIGIGHSPWRQDVDYGARRTHTAQSGQTLNNRFDVWDRIDNDDGRARM
jgi:hypothetical protein